jgi:23S rRNA (guanosine2251-2'-O)-methyltransferase
MIFEKGEDPLLVLLDGITDVRNFGAIARSAECLGAHAVVIPFKGGAAVNPDAVKTSAGALMRLPVCKVQSMQATIDWLQASGIQVIGMTEKASQEIQQTLMPGPVAVVMGAEDTGLSKEVMMKADDLVKIPMTGNIGSLNVSVSAGIALYEISRQKKQ